MRIKRNKKGVAIASAVLTLVTSLRAWKNKRTATLNTQKKTKKCWVRPVLWNRGTCGFYATLRSKLRQQDPRWFKNFLQMDMEDFDDLVERLTPFIGKQNTRFRESISVGERLAVTLRYLATGDSFSSLVKVFLLGKTTICHIVRETCAAILQGLKGEFLKVPDTADKWSSIAEMFLKQWNFPNCCGAFDGKHIMIQVPGKSSSHNSILLMALVDAEYKFLSAEVAYGRETDEEVLARCPLLTALADNTINFPEPKPLPQEDEPMPFVILADDAFPLKPYLMKPVPNSEDEQVNSHTIFNYRLSRARNVVENVFGICATRFRILRRALDLKPENAKAVVLAICVLHNFLVSRKSVYLTKADVDDDDKCGKMVQGNWRSELGEDGILPSIRVTSRREAENALNIRESFMEYFMTPHGEIPGQYNNTIQHNKF